MTAAQAASKVPAANIALTLSVYLALYAALLVAYIKVVFHLAAKAGQVIESADAADSQAGALPRAGSSGRSGSPGQRELKNA